MLFIDAHCHIGPTESKHTPEEQIATQKQAGISGAIFSPTPCNSTLEMLDAGNASALDLYDKYPDFLYPAVVVNPLFPERSLYWLEAFHERGLIWCGEWLGYTVKIELDDPGWAPFFEFSEKHNMIVQMHNAPSVPVIAKRYPGLTMIASHLYKEILPQLTEYTNVLVDFSGMNGGLCSDSLTDALNMFGEDRLLFGTDMPGYDPLPFVIRSKRDFPPETLRKIAAGNLRRLFAEHGGSFPVLQDGEL